MTKRQSNQLDKQIEAIYYANCSGVQVDIMDIGSIFKAGRDAAAGGPEAMTAAVLARVAEVRKN